MSNTAVVTGTAQVLISEDQAFAVALQSPQSHVVVEQPGTAVIAVIPQATTAVIEEQVVQAVALQIPQAPAVVEVITEGPQGVGGVSSLAELDDVNTTSKVNQSVLYYDASSGHWRGDDINTITTITDGGSF